MFASCSIPTPDDGPCTGEEPMTQAPAATMEILEVTGGVPLHGEVTVRGAKNSVPKDMVAALLTEDDCVISNVPRIQDVDIVSDMLTVMGGEVATPEPGTLRISTAGVRPTGLDDLKRFAGSSRIPILLCGPLLHRFGEAVVPTLGGCEIGSRSVQFHIDALRSLGASVDQRSDGIHLKADKLVGTKLRLREGESTLLDNSILMLASSQGDELVLRDVGPARAQDVAGVDQNCEAHGVPRLYDLAIP